MSEQNKPIIVLGMHRSGTSCLAGSLHKSGVYFGDVSLKNRFNKKGNRENQKIMSINDSILKFNESSWDTPPKQIKWSAEHEDLGIQLIDDFQINSKNELWGFKDPRTLLTYSFWRKILPNHNLVGTIRSPFNVALSLQSRDKNFTPKKSYDLWLHYNLLLLDIITENHFPLISFDLPNNEYQHKLINIKEFFSLPINQSDLFFDDKLRSQNTIHKLQYENEVDCCYLKLQNKLF